MSRFKAKLLKKTAEEGEGEFEVHLTAKAHASGTIRVMAKDANEAKKKAKEQASDVDWSYEGIDESTIETEVPAMPEGMEGMDMPPLGPEMDLGPEPDLGPDMGPEPGPELPPPAMEPEPGMAMGSRFRRKLNRV